MSFLQFIHCVLPFKHKDHNTLKNTVTAVMHKAWTWGKRMWSDLHKPFSKQLQWQHQRLTKLSISKSLTKSSKYRATSQIVSSEEISGFS